MPRPPRPEHSQNDLEPGGRRPPVRSVGLVGLVGLVGGGLVAVGCNSCKNDRPYVPYAIDGGSGVPQPDAHALPAPEGDSSTPERGDVGERAPPGATVWDRSGVRLRAPEGRRFERGLFADFDGDGRTDALCIVRVDTSPKAFEVYAFRGGAEETPAKLFESELVMLPHGAGRHALARAGAHGALVELSAEPAASFAQTRAFALLDLSAKPARGAVRLAFAITDPPAAPRLRVVPDSSDRDADGVADVTLTLEIEGGEGEGGAPLSAKLAFLDRPAGLARDPDEPRTSLSLHARAALTRAARPKEAAGALVVVQQALALARAVCPELPGARLSGFTGVATPSCEAGPALEDLALAEVKANATLGRPFAALAAFGRWRPPFLSRSKEKVREAEKALDAVAKPTTPREVRSVRAVPVPPKRHVPSFAPLSFGSPSELDVLTADGVVRVDLESGVEHESPSAAWVTAMISPVDATRLVEVYDACKGGPRRATFAPSGEGDAREVAIPLPTPLVPPCASSRGEPVDVVPIGWGPKGLELFVSGEPVLFDPGLARAIPLVQLLEQPGARGSARSPDGKALAVGTELGVIVRGPQGVRRVRGTRESGFAEGLHACVVNDGATRVACIEGGKVFVAVLP